MPFQCSHTCGHGMQSRRVTCHRVNSFNWVYPERTENAGCDAKQRPKEIRSCNNLPSCDVPSVWVTGSWSQVGKLKRKYVVTLIFNSVLGKPAERKEGRRDLCIVRTKKEIRCARNTASWDYLESWNQKEKESARSNYVSNIKKAYKMRLMLNFYRWIPQLCRYPTESKCNHRWWIRDDGWW